MRAAGKVSTKLLGTAARRGPDRREAGQRLVVARAQQRLFEALWAQRRDRPGPHGILEDLKRELDIRERKMPACVVADRPAVGKEELGEVVRFASRVAVARRAYLTVADMVFRMEALARTFWCRGPPRDVARLLVSDFGPPREFNWHDVSHVQPENRYWTNPRIGSRFRDDHDHEFATRVIELSLFPARDTVWARWMGSDVYRAFIQNDLRQLQALFVQLRTWVYRHTEVEGSGVLPVRRLEQSLSGILAETTIFHQHILNAWFDAVMVNLPAILGPEEEGSLSELLSSVEDLAETVRNNYVTLFMAPASLPASGHNQIMNLVEGRADPIKSFLLHARPVRAADGSIISVRAEWDTGRFELDMDRALDMGSRCGGLSEFKAVDERSEMIIRMATEELPFDPHVSPGALTPIGATTLSLCENLRFYLPRLAELAPWMDRDEWNHALFTGTQGRRDKFRRPRDPYLSPYPKRPALFCAGRLSVHEWRDAEIKDLARVIHGARRERSWQAPWMTEVLRSPEVSLADVIELLEQHLASPRGPSFPGNAGYIVRSASGPPMGLMTLSHAPVFTHGLMEVWMLPGVESKDLKSAVSQLGKTAFETFWISRLDVAIPEQDYRLDYPLPLDAPQLGLRPLGAHQGLRWFSWKKLDALSSRWSADRWVEAPRQTSV